MDGILPLWKDRGQTSHDCVFKLRKILHTKKVGHSGTLDPDVDGVLPICIGKVNQSRGNTWWIPERYIQEKSR